MEFRQRRVLIGSPIHQKPEKLKYFLSSITELNKELATHDYVFVDDNDMPESSLILSQFVQENPNTTLFKSSGSGTTPYTCDEVTHNWNEGLIWKVALFKNYMIEQAFRQQYDYLFLVDSDLVLRPITLDWLIRMDKEIISEVFWTRWRPDAPLLPQVWLGDQYNQFVRSRGENLTQEELLVRHQRFISQLKIPGVYEVGGLGACTLISRNAIIKGVSFAEIRNLSFWGEDRHFCIRASALGFTLHVDTHFPAYHIYRDTDLVGVEAYKKMQSTNGAW